MGKFLNQMKIIASKNNRKKKLRKKKFKNYWKLLEPSKYVDLLVKGL